MQNSKSGNINDEYIEVIKVAASIAGIDHEINNALTIISLSMRRIERASSKYNDDKLEKTSKLINEAILKIKKILEKLQPLKKMELIKIERSKFIKE